jgi:hypothetical protein
VLDGQPVIVGLGLVAPRTRHVEPFVGGPFGVGIHLVGPAPRGSGVVRGSADAARRERDQPLRQLGCHAVDARLS